MRRVAPTRLLSRVMQTRLSLGQKPRVCPMKLRTSAGVLMVSVSMVLFPFQLTLIVMVFVFLLGLGVVLIGDRWRWVEGPECNLGDREQTKESVKVGRHATRQRRALLGADGAQRPG